MLVIQSCGRGKGRADILVSWGRFQQNFARKLHLIGNFHKLAQIYFIVLLNTPPTDKDVSPPLAPPTALNNKHVL